MSEKDNTTLLITFETKEDVADFMQFIYESEQELYDLKFKNIIYDSQNQIINIENEK